MYGDTIGGVDPGRGIDPRDLNISIKGLEDAAGALRTLSSSLHESSGVASGITTSVLQAIDVSKASYYTGFVSGIGIAIVVFLIWSVARSVAARR